MNNNPFAVLAQEAPQAAQAYSDLIAAVCASGGLDDKTRQLIYIGITTPSSLTACWGPR